MLQKSEQFSERYQSLFHFMLISARFDFLITWSLIILINISRCEVEEVKLQSFVKLKQTEKSRKYISNTEMNFVSFALPTTYFRRGENFSVGII